FYIRSGTESTVYMHNGYSHRFLYLPEGSTYTITESETMPADGYSFVSIAGERGYDESGEKEDPNTDWKTETAGEASGTQGWSGTIDYVESAYKVTVTNKWNTIDVKLKKVDENGDVLNGSTFKLTSGETTIGTYSPDSSTEDGNPIDLGGLGLGTYKLEETTVPAYYQGAEDINFEVYKDTDGSLKAQLIGSPTGVELKSETGTDGLIYTFTVTNTRKTATVKVTKNVVGLEGDKSKAFAFTTTGVAEQSQTANLVGDATAENHSVTYANIPYGTSITVTETADGSFDTTYSVNGAEAITETSATFTVDDTTVNSEGIAEVIFTNTRNKQLIRVFKYETGTSPEKALDGAEFTITGPEGSDISYSGTTDEDGYLVCNQKKLIELPVNTGSYTLTETKAPNGYNKITEDVVFTVSATAVVGAGESETITVDGVQVTVYTIKVQNSAGAELPMTGGHGTLPYTLCGLLLMLGSALMYGFRMRRRERRYY
ncbi:MAG: LPXTG cell wall anchor domain-containing protein, partial [Dehalococcoidales bacterium]|nr:LPXTG cell wall anchor domain-containing protein [Dehalococcoidales bacterium]